MSILTSVQYSVFSNNRIEPTPNVVSDMLSELNAMSKYTFIPSMIIGKNIDLLAEKVNPINNISFVTIDQQVRIACMNERIDVEINGTQSNQTIPIEEHIGFARCALSKIMQQNHIYSNRLAININLLSDCIEDPIQDSSLGRKLCNTLDFYNGAFLEEWSSRVNSRRPIQIDDTELLNVITELSSVLDSATGKKRFLCHMDINTIFENAGYRFSFGSLEKFDSEVIKIITEIKRNFEEVNNGQ